MKLDRKLLIILLIQITEVLGFSLILPFLPFYAQSLGASPLMVSLILSLFSLLQFISAPILGRLSDVFGRKPLLIASQVSTFISFLVLGRATTLGMIFLSRAIDGALGSNYTIAQAYISDISSKKDRSKAFGISGMAFGFGFLIGPAIGGYLSRFGFSVPAFVAAGIALVTIVLTALYLPETVKREKELEKIKIIDLKVFSKYLTNNKTVRPLMILLTYSLTHVIWSSNFALYFDKKIGFTATEVGWILAYVGLISIFIRGFLLGRLVDLWGEVKAKKMGMVSIFVGLIGMMIVPSVWWILPIITLFAFGSGLVRPLMMGAVSKSASESEQGAVMGVANSIGSVAQIVGPVAGGYLLTHFFPESVLLLSLGVISLGMLIIFIKGKVVE
jgi:MFS transporter, DHA1 family, tetracycline resistance protein